MPVSLTDWHWGIPGIAIHHDLAAVKLFFPYLTPHYAEKMASCIT